MAHKIYGNPISIAEANEMTTRGMTIKGKFNEAIEKLTSEDAESKRFYCGGDALYVFSKSTLQPLLDRITQNDDCLVIYPGCRKDEMGRPTLIAFVYQLQMDGKLHLMKDLTDEGKDGSEHPGGNGRFTLNKRSLPGGAEGFEIPDIINPTQINFGFD